MKTALRHLLRDRRRSLLTLLAVMIPVYILVLMFGLISGEMRGMFEGAVNLETGHFQIQKVEEHPEGGALPLIDDPGKLLAIVDRSKGVAWHTVRLDLPALAAVGNRSQGIVVQGVIPDEISRINPIKSLIVSGKYLSGNGRSAVVGSALARLLHLKVGDKLVLLGAHPDSGLGVAKATVAGIFDAPDETMNRSIVQVDVGLARQLVNRPHAATAIIGYVSGVNGPWDAWKIDRIVGELRAEIPSGYKVLDWRELSPALATYMRIARPVLSIFAGIFFVLGGLVVLNTVYLSVLERTHELGVIISLGASGRQVMRMILTEAGILGVAGGISGALSGTVLVWIVEMLGGLRLPGPYTRFFKAIGMTPLLHLRVTPIEVLGSALAMIGVAILSAWYPAHHAAKLEPMEAIRNVR